MPLLPQKKYTLRPRSPPHGEVHLILFLLAALLIAYLIGRLQDASETTAHELHSLFALILLLLGASSYLPSSSA